MKETFSIKKRKFWHVIAWLNRGNKMLKQTPKEKYYGICLIKWTQNSQIHRQKKKKHNGSSLLLLGGGRILCKIGSLLFDSSSCLGTCYVEQVSLELTIKRMAFPFYNVSSKKAESRRLVDKLLGMIYSFLFVRFCYGLLEVFFLAVIKIEPKAYHMQAKCSTNELS